VVCDRWGHRKSIFKHMRDCGGLVWCGAGGLGAGVGERSFGEGGRAPFPVSNVSRRSFVMCVVLTVVCPVPIGVRTRDCGGAMPRVSCVSCQLSGTGGRRSAEAEAGACACVSLLCRHQ